MEFTIDAYRQLLNLIRSKGYPFCFYHEADLLEKAVILRHDVDFSLDKAVEMAKLEHEMGIRSTYFILLTTDFYNVFSKRSYEKLNRILSYGHEIGLHFDEKRYEIHSIDNFKKYVELEATIIGNLLNIDVKVVSMHRPSILVLDNDIQFDHLINTYSSKYFKKMKYLSDSRLSWREDPIATIESGRYKKLQILTHPFSYTTEYKSLETRIRDFLKKAIYDRYDYINENFTALNQVVRKEDI